MKESKHSYLILVLLMSLTLATATGCEKKSTASGQSSTGWVTETSMTETVDTSGTVSAKQLATLTWGTSGNVLSINVKTGDQVKEGEELMRLDSSTAPAEVIGAISTLVTAQADLELAKQSNTALAEAEVALAEAKDAYYQALGYSYTLGKPVGSEDYNAVLKKTMVDAQDAVNKLEDQYSHYGEYADNDPGKVAVRAALGAARLELKQATSIYNYYINPPNYLDTETIKAELNLATAKLDDAQRKYDDLKENGNADAITSAQAAVDAAQATVNKLSILAPFKGEVAVIYSQVGDVVSSGTQALALVDRSKLYLDVLVDETSISAVKVGNKSEINFDSQGITTTGKVTRIDPIGVTSNGVVNFTVRVELDKNDEEILIGSTATVVITTGDPQSVLFVPVSAVLNDAQGEYVMRVKEDGSTERVSVVSGKIVDDNVIVVGDLKKGDKLLLNAASSDESAEEQQNGFGGGMMGGGDMPPGGGEPPRGGGSAPMP